MFYTDDMNLIYPGYTGSHCQEDINECLNHPCLNGGQCVNLIGGYQCLCLDGFHGHDCNDLDQICPVCQNGATECYNGNCVCLPGFVGPDCGKGTVIKTIIKFYLVFHISFLLPLRL